MASINTISVKDLLGTSINTREAASLLMEVVRQEQFLAVELDFSDVEFISRSFADQFHKEKMEWRQKNGINIPLLNAKPNIIEMLQAVAKTQNASDRRRDYIQRYKFNTTAQLEQFLMSI